MTTPRPPSAWGGSKPRLRRFGLNSTTGVERQHGQYARGPRASTRALPPPGPHWRSTPVVEYDRREYGATVGGSRGASSIAAPGFFSGQARPAGLHLIA